MATEADIRAMSLLEGITSQGMWAALEAGKAEV